MGSVRGVGVGVGAQRRPNTTAYFVVLALILVLLALLFCYFIYFCVTKVKELTREDSPLNQPCPNTAQSRQQTTTNYPVQQGVRDSATAMARLCKQLPPAARTVHPAASPLSPDTSTADPATESTLTNDGSDSADPDKLPARPAVCSAAGVVAVS